MPMLSPRWTSLTSCICRSHASTSIHGPISLKVDNQNEINYPSNYTVPKFHKFITDRLMNKYFDVIKTHPGLIYDYTDKLQIVKPYSINIKTNLTRETRKMTLYDYTMKFTTLALPNNVKSRFITKRLESGNVLIDGKVMPGSKLLSNKTSIVRKSHHHEFPIPRFDVSTLKPNEINKQVSYIDKSPGLPCIPNMFEYAYNSLQFMIFVHGYITKPVFLLNDIGSASGLVFLYTNGKMGAKLIRRINSGEMKFTYCLKVHGNLDKSDLLETELLRNMLIDKLTFDPLSDTSILHIEGTSQTLLEIRRSLSEIGHPVVNDWRFLRNHHVSVDNSLEVIFGSKRNSVFYGKKLIQDAPFSGGIIMRNPMTSKADHVIKSKDLKISKDLIKYYKQYKQVSDSYDQLESCAECLVTRLPLPVELMCPNIHLYSIQGPGLKCESTQNIPWMT